MVGLCLGYCVPDGVVEWILRLIVLFILFLLCGLMLLLGFIYCCSV